MGIAKQSSPMLFYFHHAKIFCVKIITTLLFAAFSYGAFAQTYPFAEGFEGMPNTQVPSNWGGSMKVLQNHGLNDLKALCARVSSAVSVDSSITPLIGPLTSSSVLSFYYRVIDQANYPSTPTNLDNGDSIEILLSADSVNYQTVFLIDLNNHNPSFNFVKKKVYLSQFAGSNVNFKIRCHYATGASFFVDIDTVLVKDDTQAGIEDISNESSFSLYPNPVSQFAVCNLQFAASKQPSLKIFNSIGQEVFYSPSVANCQLPIADFSPGLYFVQVGNTTRKLIIE